MSFVFPEIVMDDDEFRQLSDLVYRNSGLYFGPEMKYLLERRLGKRLRILELKSFRDYYYYLRYHQNKAAEFVAAIDCLTTNETYFFREEAQLKTFTGEILPEIRKKKENTGDKELRIWSAGCSSGEEPYTIAMLMIDMPSFDDWRINIIGTDINQRVLQSARKGVYGPASFRSTDAYYRKRFFTEVDGQYRISDQVRTLVSISHLNLFDVPRVALLGKVDLIFCRNVIIYFDPPAKKKIVESFYHRLRPEGFLLLGHSESLLNISNDFAPRHFRRDLVYQRPATRFDVESRS